MAKNTSHKPSLRLAERARKAAMSKSVASKSGAKKIRMTLRQSHGDDSGSGRSSAGPMVDFIVRGDEVFVVDPSVSSLYTSGKL